MGNIQVSLGRENRRDFVSELSACGDENMRGTILRLLKWGAFQDQVKPDTRELPRNLQGRPQLRFLAIANM